MQFILGVKGDWRLSQLDENKHGENMQTRHRKVPVNQQVQTQSEVIVLNILDTASNKTSFKYNINNVDVYLAS